MAANSNISWIIQITTTNIASLLLNTNFDLINISGPGALVKDSVGGFSNGTYTDFTYKWFKTVGTAVALSNVLMALKQIYKLLPYFKRRWSQWGDRSYTSDRRKTKKST